MKKLAVKVGAGYYCSVTDDNGNSNIEKYSSNKHLLIEDTVTKSSTSVHSMYTIIEHVSDGQTVVLSDNVPKNVTGTKREMLDALYYMHKDDYNNPIQVELYTPKSV